jgi:hypothetical protein
LEGTSEEVGKAGLVGLSLCANACFYCGLLGCCGKSDRDQVPIYDQWWLRMACYYCTGTTEMRSSLGLCLVA